MVNKTIVLFFALAFVSCNERANNLNVNNDSTKLSQLDSFNNNQKKLDSIDKKDNSVTKQHKSIIENIKGLWVLVGDETGNVSFDIQNDSIYYPDLFKSYSYSIVDDSIKIKFSDYTGSYLVELKGTDTLLFNGEKKEKYYRSK